MSELVRALKHICSSDEPQCSATAYSYVTTKKSMRNAANLWASLRKVGNETSISISSVNNKTGIIHFAFNTSRYNLKSTKKWKQFQNSIGNQ
ncbi:unnamed protein product [Orchesella dallaii]|uniref:Uncharacterized protein n=1 Tax=Orchesella dallaii TaxID=48710 RepID=A0ABP1S4C1_9HEXA